MSLIEALAIAASGNEVEPALLESAFGEIMDGEASESQIAGLLVALHTKGETSGEIVAAVRAMRARADTAPLPAIEAVDTAGTGGDGAGTFNISTIAAFVVAGAGVPVVKHGNQGASSLCGSFNVLEALGVKANLSIAKAADISQQAGIGFFYARRAHPAMRFVADVRQKLGIRTMMNCVGPLLNPVSVRRQLVGVYDDSLVDIMAAALSSLGAERALVVHGNDGLDELTTTTTSRAVLWDGSSLREYQVDPAELGLRRAVHSELRGGDSDTNAAIGLAVLAGEAGAHRDIVLLNAAGALWAAGAVKDLRQGLTLAKNSIDTGEASARLNALIKLSQAM